MEHSNQWSHFPYPSIASANVPRRFSTSNTALNSTEEQSYSDDHHEDDGNYTESPSFSMPVEDPLQKMNSSNVLHLSGLPAKSRVETRMKLCLKITSGESGILGSKDVPKFRIDEPLLASPILRTRVTPEKRLQQKNLQQPSAFMPILVAQVYDSSGGRLLNRCASCVDREKKVLTKKSKRKEYCGC